MQLYLNYFRDTSLWAKGVGGRLHWIVMVFRVEKVVRRVCKIVVIRGLKMLVEYCIGLS